MVNLWCRKNKPLKTVFYDYDGDIFFYMFNRLIYFFMKKFIKKTIRVILLASVSMHFAVDAGAARRSTAYAVPQKIGFFYDGGSDKEYVWEDYAKRPFWYSCHTKATQDNVYSTKLSNNAEDYNVVAVGKNRGAADNIFILRAEKKNKGEYFKWTLYKRVAGMSDVNKVALTEDLSGRTLGGGKANDFVENYDFMKMIRHNTKRTKGYDPINGYVSNNVRRNEIFQSMATMETCDWNGNGTEDVYVVAGGKVTIFDGNTLDKLAQFDIDGINSGTEVSVSAVAGDFRQNGQKEVLVMCLAVDPVTKNEKSDYSDEKGVHGVKAIALLIPNGEKTPVYRDIKTSDLTANKKIINSHPTISIESFYPDGSKRKPMLAVATNVLAYDNKNNKNINFHHTLSLFDVDFARRESLWIWYSRQSQKDYKTIAIASYQTFISVQDRPFYFGRPALKQAFIRGADAPAYLFWNSAVYNYNKAEKNLNTSVSIDVPKSENRKGSDNAQFDHVIGGNVATVSCPKNPDDMVNGRESLVFPYSGSYYISDGTIHIDHDWKDAFYGMYRISMKENNTGFYLHDGPHFSIYDNSPINVVTFATEAGKPTVGVEENVADNIAAVVAGNNAITVTSAIGDVNVEIVNLQGVKVVEKIVNGTEQFSLPAGFYVVKAGDTVKKVML